MAFPTPNWPTSLDSAESRVDYTDIVWANDFNWQEDHRFNIQTWLGITGDLIGDGIAGEGPGGAVSPIASGGVAFQIAARNLFASGKLLSVGDNYDSSYDEKLSLDYAGDLSIDGHFYGDGGSTSAPTYSISGDPNTGMYSSVADTLEFSCGNTKAAEMTSQGLGLPDGAVSEPSIYPVSDANTGIYFTSTNVRVAISSSEALRVNPSYLMTLITGSAATYYFNRTDQPSGAIDVGILRARGKSNADAVIDYGEIVFRAGDVTDGSEGGVIKFQVADSGNSGTMTLISRADEQGLGVINGSESEPSIYFISDIDTGLYRSGTNVLGIATGSVRTAEFFTSANVGVLELHRDDQHGSGQTAGHIRFTGKDSAGTPADVIYAQILGYCESDTTGSEAGSLHVRVADSGNSGGLTNIAIFDEDGFYIDIDGTEAAPSLSWIGDANTGIYHSTDTIEFTCGGSKVSEFTSQGIGVVGGSLSAPGVYIIGDTGTGIYSGTAGYVSVTCNTSLHTHFYKSANVPYLKTSRTDAHGDGVTIANILMAGRDDGASEAVYASILGYCVQDAAGGEGGEIDFRVADSGNSGIVTKIVEITERGIGVIDGAETAPSIYFTSETDLGIFRKAAGDIGFADGSAEIWALSATALRATGTRSPYIRRGSGSPAAPQYSWQGSGSTGMYASAADIIEFSSASVKIAQIDADGIYADPGISEEKQTVTSSSNKVDVDVQGGHIVYHTLTENTTFQAPTNEIEGAMLTFVILQGTGSSYTVSFDTGLFPTGGGKFALDKNDTFPKTISSRNVGVARFVYDSSLDLWVQVTPFVESTVLTSE